jgi:hypothetical protein
MAVGDFKIVYAANQVMTITLASLATDANLLTGREGTAIDNTTTLYDDFLLDGKITVGTTPTTAKEIRIYVVGLFGDASWPDVFDGTDSAETVSQVGVRDSACKLAAVMATVATSDQGYPFGPISVAALFGGTLPKKFAVFVTHNTAVNLHATAGNHYVNAMGIYYNSAAA